MKKIILFSTMLSLLFSCDNGDVSGNFEKDNLSVEENIEQISYNVNGEDIVIDISLLENEFYMVQNENTARLKEMFDSDGFVTYVDSNEEAPLLFTSLEKFHEFKSDEERLKARRIALGRPQELINLDKSSSKNSARFVSLGRNRGSGPEVNIPINTRYSNRHLGFNTCITGGISFQDNISSIFVDSGVQAHFYVRDDYRGNTLLIDATESTSAIGWNDLREIRRRTFTRIDASGDFINNLCRTPWCSTWNDKFSSMSAVVSGVNPFTNRNTTNVCGTRGGGGGGGGGGGADGDGPIK